MRSRRTPCSESRKCCFFRLLFHKFMRANIAALITLHASCEVAAHGHLLTPDFRKRMAIGKQINGYYVYWPYAEFAPTCVQGHCFGATSFRCKDTAAEAPTATVSAAQQI